MMEQSAAAPSEFNLSVDAQQAATVVHCSGRLTIADGAFLRAEVMRLVRPGARMVLDLTNVTHCDSSGLGAVISLYVTSKSAGWQLEVINLGPRVRQLFSMTNLLSLFEPAADSTCRFP
jgi:anti-sigma B factor antagonist